VIDDPLPLDRRSGGSTAGNIADPVQGTAFVFPQ